MANEQTSVPLYAAAEVLTAANMNISAGTGVPVFATTVTRDAAFGGAGEKVLAEGQLCYLSDSNIVQYYTGAAWATVGPASPGALTLIKTQTIGTTVGSVAVTSAFSSTYDNYKIIINGGVGSTESDLAFQLGATTTGYYGSLMYGSYGGGAATNAASSNQANFLYCGSADTGNISSNFDVLAPNLAKKTSMNGQFVRQTTGGICGATNSFLNNTTQYTDFTILASTGTFTGGTIYVYGYAKA
jgi:hypothetical protein